MIELRTQSSTGYGPKQQEKRWFEKAKLMQCITHAKLAKMISRAGGYLAPHFLFDGSEEKNYLWKTRFLGYLHSEANKLY